MKQAIWIFSLLFFTTLSFAQTKPKTDSTTFNGLVSSNTTLGSNSSVGSQNIVKSNVLGIGFDFTFNFDNNGIFPFGVEVEFNALNDQGADASLTDDDVLMFHCNKRYIHLETFEIKSNDGSAFDFHGIDLLFSNDGGSLSSCDLEFYKNNTLQGRSTISINKDQWKTYKYTGNTDNIFYDIDKIIIRIDDYWDSDETTVKIDNIVINNSPTIELSSVVFNTIRPQDGKTYDTVYIKNKGYQPLKLTNRNPISINGTHASEFSIVQQPTSPIAVDDSSQVIIAFDPTTTGKRVASLKIENNARDSNYTINIHGFGDKHPEFINIWANANGKFSTNDSIYIRITADETVTVTGSPTLKLETGDTDRTAVFERMYDHRTLEFLYRVQLGDSIFDLDVFNASAFAKNGASIKDSTGNEMLTTTLPIRNQNGALRKNQNIEIDAIPYRPVNVSATNPNGTYGQNSIITILVEFNTPVTVSGNPTILLDCGNQNRSAFYNSGSGTKYLTFYYTVSAGDSSADLSYTSVNALLLNNGTIKDHNGNDLYSYLLPALNDGGSLKSNKDLVINTSTPGITNVTATNNNGSFNAVNSIYIQIEFENKVNVTGTPTLELETGTTNRKVSYYSGSGSTTLTFKYTVQNGDSSLDLNYSSNNALSLNGGSIKDAGANAANLTLPALASTNSLAGQKNLIIDTRAPSALTVNSTKANGAFRVGEQIPILVKFNENISVTGTPYMLLNNGRTGGVKAYYSSGSGGNTITFLYEVEANDSTTDLDYLSTNAIELNGGSIRDNAGNNATLTLAAPGASGSLSNAKNIVVDNHAPFIVSVSSSVSDGSYSVNDIIPVEITFSENVKVTGNPTLELETGSTDRVISFNSGSNSKTLTFNYTVQNGDASADLDYTSISALAVNSASITDFAGNPSNLNLPTPGANNSLSKNKDIEILSGLATVSSVNSPNVDSVYNVGDTIYIQVNFSKSVAVSGSPTLKLETGSNDEVIPYVSGSSSSILTFRYIIKPGNINADLDYKNTAALSLNGGSIKDADGNNARLTLISPGLSGSLSDNKDIVINDAPTLNYIPVQETCENETIENINFTIDDEETAASSLRVVTAVAWANIKTVKVGGTGANRTLTFVPKKNFHGLARVLVLVQDGGYAIDSQSVFVKIHAKPTVAFTADTVCLNDTTVFVNNTASRGYSIQSSSWDFGDGSASSQYSPKRVYSSAGTYTVGLITATTKGCIDTLEKDIVVNSLPTPSFAVSNLCLVDTFAPSLFASTATQKWYYGDGSSATTTDPKRKYAAAGSYTIKLVENNALGCSDSLEKDITVYPMPNAAFSANDTCFGDAIRFQNGSSIPSGQLDFDWSFGDANSSSNRSPLHTFNNSGTFNIKLKAESGFGCADSVTKQVEIIDLPSMQFNFASACVNDSTTFSNNSSGAISYVWKFGDGTQSTAANPKHVYTSSGYYSVTLIGTNSSGCIDSIVKTVQVYALPTASFTVNNVCLNDSASFVNNSSSAQSFKWQFGQGRVGTSTQEEPTFLYPNSGIFQPSLIAYTSQGCTDTVSKSITIYKLPTANFSANEVCESDSMAFINQSNLGSTYTWDFDNGNTSNSASPKIKYASDGSYNVSLIAQSSQGCLDTIEKTVVVNPLPQVKFSAQNNCLGDSTQITNTSTGASQYLWQLGNGQSSTAQQFKYQYQNDGDYTIKVVATTNKGCVDSLQKGVTIYPLPKVAFNKKDVCLGEKQLFLNKSSISSGSLSYLWDFDDTQGQSTNSSPEYTFTKDGTYNVKLIASSNYGCIDSLSQSVKIYALPKIAFTASNVCLSDSITTNNNTTGASTYIWKFGDGNSSNLSNPKHKYSVSGYYTIQLKGTSSFGCQDSTQKAIQIYSLPSANFSVNDVCSYDSARFQNLSSGAATYAWSFNDGNSSTATEPVYKYASNGKYQVQLIAYSAGSCSDTISKQLSILALPKADFNAQAICAKDTMRFVNTSRGANSFKWDFGNGNFSNSASPNIYQNKAGNYNVELIASTASGCSDTAVKTVTVYALPTPLFTVNNNCLVDSTEIEDFSQNVNSYTWSLGDGNTQNSSSFKHKYSTSGSYNIKLVAKAGTGCTDSLTKTVTVYPMPKPDFNHKNVCEGSKQLLLNKTTLSSGSLDYLWHMGDGVGKSSNTSPEYTYSTDGNYSIKLIATTDKGCSDSITKSVSIYPLPEVDFSAKNVCLSDSMHFNNKTTGANNYTWDFDDLNNSVTSAPKHKYANPGYYDVNLTATTSNGCVDSVNKTVQVYNMPTAGFTQTNVCLNDTMLFTDNSAEADKYTYYLGDRSMASTANAAHLYKNDGKYSVLQMVETNNGCKDSLRKTVEVYALPIADFTAPTVCFTDSTKFANKSSNYSSSKWSFGNGASSILKSPTLLYGKAGNYTVQLITESDKGCFDTISKTVTVNALPQVAFTVNDTCFGKANSFSNNTSGASFYAWSFGDRNTSTAQTPTHTYAKDGNFSVKLIARTSLGCRDSASNQTTIHPLPKVSFTQSNVCFGNAMSFKNTSSIKSGLNSYAWNFGDNSSSANISPSHTYGADGAYSVLLTATSNQGCVDSSRKSVTVFALPNPAFTVNNECLNDTFKFNNTSTGATSYAWNFGDSKTSTANNPKHQYTVAGFYTAKLVATSNNNCVDSFSRKIQVFEMPTAGFTQTNVCLNDTMFFTDNSSAADKYTYYFGGRSMASSANATHLYKNDGKYSVLQIVETNHGCVDSLRKTVEVYALPVADFTAPTVCFTDSTKFSNNSSNAIDFNWNLGDGSSSALKAPTKLYGKAGKYSVELITESAKGCLDTITKTVTVNALPQVAFTMNDTCFGKANNFSNSTSGASTYAWSFGDGNTSTAQTPTHTYAKDGNFSVKLIARTSLGCRDSASTQITIHPLPKVSFTQSNVCFGNAMSFKNTSSIKSGLNSYAWNFGDNSSSANTSPSHTYGADGAYSVLLTATSNQGCVDSSRKSVTVFALPNPAFTVNNECLTDTFNFNNTSTGAASYAWNFGDSKTSTVSNPQHQYSVAGFYTAKLIATSANNCVDSFSRKIQAFEMPTAGFTQTNVCMNDTMFFTDNSSVADKYTYYFGGRKMANTANAKHLYGNSGKYSVLQIVETSNGCRDSLRKTVEVYALPVADFSAPTVCYTDSTQFANNSNNYVSSKWSFGNGASSILNNPTLLYGKAKNYSVELIAESSKGCLDTVTKTVTVNALPQVAFTMNDTCFGKANTFTNNTSGASSYDWSYGDGNSSTAQTPSHTYSKDGSFDVKLIATTSLGCQDSASNQITIHPLPKVSFTQSNVCDGVSMYFKNGSSISKGTNTYLWLFGNRQTSANTSPWHLYANTGKYDVKLIATSDRGCKDSISKQVEVYAQPEAAFSHTDVCNGFDMHFTNETKLAHNVNWSFGDGLLSTDQNPTHLFVKDGRFNVQLKTSTAYCSDSISKTVSVYKKPIAGFTLDSTCLGGPINFTNTSFYGEINTHDWTFGDGSGSALINPKKVYKEHGSYNVQLIVTTDNNCKDTANATAVVHPNPKAKFNTTNVCAYDSTEFNNNSSIASGNIAKYKWSFGNGLFSSQASPSHFYGKSGSYTVVLTAISDFGCTNFTDTLIQVFEVPNADFTSTIVCEENYTTFTDQSIGNIKSYSWSFEDGNTSIDKNPRNLYSLFGNYNVQLIVESQNGCLDTVLKNTSVLDKPEAIFSAQPVCYLQITEFTNTSVAAIESFWNFGDEEGFSGLDNPNYNYLNPGVYDVELQVVSAQGCRDTIINQVEVYELPIANFSVINHCFRDELFPTDKSIGNVSNWTWQMGDGETLTGSAPSHIYSIDGEYTINLNVEDANGCIDSVKRKVIVHPLPVMNISADTIVSKGYEVPLLATGGTYYNWGPNFGLNKYDIANPVATVTEDVTYTVSITTEYGCESDTFVTLRALDDYTVEPSNIITPDGNGKNDYWIVEKANYYDDIEVIVFDRWGRIVYQAKPYKNNWDGTVNGKPLPDGAYYYIIKVPTERESYKGSITIFR